MSPTPAELENLALRKVREGFTLQQAADASGVHVDRVRQLCAEAQMSRQLPQVVVEQTARPQPPAQVVNPLTQMMAKAKSAGGRGKTLANRVEKALHELRDWLAQNEEKLAKAADDKRKADEARAKVDKLKQDLAAALAEQQLLTGGKVTGSAKPKETRQDREKRYRANNMIAAPSPCTLCGGEILRARGLKGPWSKNHPSCEESRR